MSRDASGNFTLAAGNPVQAGTVITTQWANPTLSDIAAALTDSLSRTGKGGMQAPLAMGTNKITGVAPATLGTDAPTAAQVRNSAFSWLFPVSSDAGGNAYAGTALLPDAPVAGTVFFFLADKINTGSLTLQVNAGAVLPVISNGSAVPAGAIAVGAIIEVVFFANAYVIIGGIGGSGGSGTVNSVLSTNPQAVTASIAGSLLTIQPNTNIASGLLQLDSGGIIPVAYVPTLATSYIGQFNATPNANPANGTAQGQFYIISNAGTLNLFRLASGQNFTAQATSVAVADRIIWNQVNTGAQPTGWYYVSSSGAPTTAAVVTVTPTTTFPAATNQQAWDVAADAFMLTLLPKSGGTMTGPIVWGTLPSAAGQLANKQYVDNTFASIPAAVTTFNTRNGAVTLNSTDVTGALTFTPANIAGAAFTGAVSSTAGFTSKAFSQTQYVANITGATTLPFSNGQSQVLTSTGASTISAITGLSVGTILRCVFIATNLGPTTWPVSVKWPNGITPDLAAGTLKRAIVAFEFDGTNILANAAVY